MKDVYWGPGTGESSGTSNCKPQLKTSSLRRLQTKQILTLTGYFSVCSGSLSMLM